MILGQLPRGPLVKKEENGEDFYMTLEWRRWFSQMQSNVQVYLNNEGYLQPVTGDVAGSTKAGAKNRGTFFYDGVNDNMILNVAGTLKKIVVASL